jgi:hypothetical protein
MVPTPSADPVSLIEHMRAELTTLREAQQRPIQHGPTKEEWERAHEAIKADREIWTSLTVDGFQSNGLGGLIEHRRCPACRSSISRECTAIEAFESLSWLAGVHARSLEAITDAAICAAVRGQHGRR